ncbi:MAG: type II toxin-antitoxin system HicA family toxin [Nitrospinae bacterium]|nr:type II toxin-antitoxin system HicA family toxin [Nitrospinota bacterium]
MSLKPYQGRELVRVLTLVGWTRAGREGQHFLLTAPDGRRVTIPDLGKEPLPEAASAAILAHAGMRP